MKPRSSSVRRCQPLLGTFVEIAIADETRSVSELHALASASFEQIARVHALMSFHDPASELSRLNRLAHLQPVHVHLWTKEVIREAVRFAELSAGTFDVTVAKVLQSWGFLPTHEQAPPLDHGASYRDIELHPDGSISFQRPLQVDLGGIAKGFAVDKAAELLGRAGVRSAVVNAGGDLRFVGERPQTIVVRNPAEPRSNFVEVELAASAVATSGTYFAQPGSHSHIVHPRLRTSLRIEISATLFAQTCLQADALTKIALLADAATTSDALAHEKASCIFLPGNDNAKIVLPAAA